MGLTNQMKKKAFILGYLPTVKNELCDIFLQEGAPSIKKIAENQALTRMKG